MTQIFNPEHPITALSASHAPIGRVTPGEVFILKTLDCYGDQIKTEADLRPNIDISLMNGATGPIYIEGAEKGGNLCVHVLDIELAAQGVMVTSPKLGPLGKQITEPNTRIIKVAGGRAYFSEKISFPLRPMIGVIGTAPAGDPISTVVPGEHGGNMDCTLITSGTRVHFPVFHKGALLAAGDLHASMGDGELSGTGIEIGGAVTLKTSLSAFREPLRAPLLELGDSFYTVASAMTLDEAVVAGVEEGVRLISLAQGLSMPDAYRLFSATCDAQICQTVNPKKTIRVKIPRAWLQPLL